MPEFIEEETGRRLYHENETTLDIEKEIAKKFAPKKGEVSSSYMHRDMDEEEPYDVDRAIDADGNPVLQEKAKLTLSPKNLTTNPCLKKQTNQFCFLLMATH